MDIVHIAMRAAVGFSSCAAVIICGDYCCILDAFDSGGLSEAHVKHTVAHLITRKLYCDEVHSSTVKLSPVRTYQLLLETWIDGLTIAVDVSLSLRYQRYLFQQCLLYGSFLGLLLVVCTDAVHHSPDRRPLMQMYKVASGRRSKPKFSTVAYSTRTWFRSAHDCMY